MRKIILSILLAATATLHAEDIVFADAAVKAICISSWDTNGDGELSMEEAAAVTTLGSVFREKSGITSFEELQYFTGLTTINSYAFYKSSIQKVIFPPTVQSIGEYAFAQSNISGELNIPGTVKEISDYAFNKCKNMTRIVLGKGVETVGWHTFSGHILSFIIPPTLTSMSSMAIDPYLSTSDFSLPDGDYLYVYSNAATPATIDNYAFYYVFAEAHLVVPIGQIEAYKAVAGWSHFGEYLEFGDINMDGVIDGNDLDLLDDYLTGVADDDFNKDIADIDGDGDVTSIDRNLLADAVSQLTPIENILIDDHFGGNTMADTKKDAPTYNLAGQRVSNGYRGIVIRNGRKYLNK